MIKKVRTRSQVYPSLGRCIYCESDGSPDGLRDEHIVPDALGGRLTIKRQWPVCLSLAGKKGWPQPKGFVFWESVRAFENAAEFYSVLGMQTDSDLDRHLAEHVHALAGIAKRKFYCSAWSVLLALVGGVLTGIAVVLGSG